MARRLQQVIPRFDVVHIHSLYLFPTLVAGYYARQFRIPYLIRPHGTLHPYLRRRHKFRKAVYNAVFEGRNLNQAAAIHYTSANEMEAAAPLHLAAPGVVVPLGISFDEFASLPPRGKFRERYPQLAQKRVVAFLGRLTRKKGIDLLIRAMAAVANEIDDTHLVIAGPDDEGYGAVVRSLLEKAGIDKRTTIVGMLHGRERIEFLVDADAWVLPSHTENFGLAVVEAMACGLPVIISDQVDIHREVSDANAGLVVACDASAIAGALSRLLNDPTFAKVLGSAAQGLVQRRFSWEAVASQLLDTYRSIVSDREPGGVHREERIANVRAG
jgi:glycosyltransferase involved in cell wall biosynthesis